DPAGPPSEASLTDHQPQDEAAPEPRVSLEPGASALLVSSGDVAPTDEQPEPSHPPVSTNAQPGEALHSQAPVAKPEAQAKLSTLLRSLALAAMICCGAVVFVWLLKGESWLPAFVKSNTFERVQRSRMIKTMVAGIGVGGLAVAVIALIQRMRGRSLENVERWLWFLSPLALLPALPMFFRTAPWAGRGDALLPLLAAFGILLEGTLARAFSHTPAMLLRGRDWLLAATPRFFARNGWTWVVVLASLSFTAFIAYYTVLSHFSLKTHNFDTGINNNLVYGMLSGRFNESPVTLGDQAQKYLAAHAKFGLYVYAPIYALRPRPETLFVIQAFSTGLAAIPLYLLARRYIAQWLAAVVALCYLAYYPMHSAAFFELKLIEFAVVHVILTAYLVDTRRWIWATLTFFASMLMRDDLPVTMAVMGAVFAFSGHRPKYGFFMAATASLWFFVLRFIIMGDKGDWWFPSMYDDLFPPGEKGFGPVAKTLITNPVFTFKNVVTEPKIYYFLHLFVPLAFLPARRAFVWVVFIPGLLFSLLTTGYKPTITYSFHYVMHWTALLFLATPFVLRSIRNRAGKARAVSAALAMLALSAITSFQWGAFTHDRLVAGFTRIDFDYSANDHARYQQLMGLVRMIPPDAEVSSTEIVGPHVS
ncbi:MAG: DUF2079 domain-containing protein, partial [Myxococcales bacterium]|nr:DUF2079 domain-containing protein [Myxococcales bacterium]